MFNEHGSIPNPDDLVTTKGGLEIYDEMKRDDAVGAFMQFRKWARLSSGWKIEAISDDNEDKRVAAFVQFVLDEFNEINTRSLLMHIMSAYDYGYSISEKVWGRINDGEWVGKWGFKKIAPKRPHAFKFALDSLGNLKEDGLINLQNYGQEVPMLVSDFIHYPYSADFNNPYGASDLRRAHPWWVMKKHLIRYQAIYFERLAGGFFDVSYDPDAVEEDEIDAMEEALASVSIMSNLLHPNGFVIDMKEGSGRGASAYDKAIQTFNSYNARTLLIPDLMGISTKATGGSYAMADKHHDSFLWVLEAMGGDLETAVFGKQAIRPLVDLNFGKNVPAPKFKFKPLSHADRIAILAAFISAVEKGVINPTEEDAKWARAILEAPEKDGEPREPAVPATPGFNPAKDNPSQVAPAENPKADGSKEPAAMVIPPFTITEYNSLRRQLKGFELKTDFTLIKKTLDDLELFIVNGWSSIAQEQLDNIISTMRSRNIIASGDFKAVDNLQLRKVGQVHTLLTNTLCTAFANAKYQAWREVLDKQEALSFRPERYAAELLLEPVPPAEAIAFFKAKGLNIKPAMMEGYKNNAFRIAGVESSEILAKAQAIISRGIRRGDALWAEAQLKKLFDKYIETGRLNADGLVSTAWHVENVVRTNISEAYNYGRLAAYEERDIANEIEGYWYSAVLDDATTAYCEWMDANSPYTKEDFEKEGPPPAHYECRSTFGAILRGEAWTPNDLKPPAKATRGEGFTREGRNKLYAT